jgi:hypothetical protein
VKPNPPIKGHALWAMWDRAYRCECGMVAPLGGGRTIATRWHREHKDDVRLARAVAARMKDSQRH